MKAAIFHAPGDIRIETVADPTIVGPGDAIVRVTAAAICGTDLWWYRGISPLDAGSRMGHEFVGVVVEVGPEVRSVRAGDWVIAPFTYSDGSCDHCRAGVTVSCTAGGVWAGGDNDGGQGEAVRVPQADGTLVLVARSGAQPDADLVPHLLALADVYSTGTHAVRSARVAPGSTVAVIGDGAVGLSAVLAARRAGAGRVVIMSRDPIRSRIAAEFGADISVAERGDGAVEAVLELTRGLGADHVLECVGTAESFASAIRMARPGGIVGYVGMPHQVSIEPGDLFFRNIAIAGGMTSARRYIPDALGPVLDGTLRPGRVFTDELDLADVGEGYRRMSDREAIKVLLRV